MTVHQIVIFLTHSGITVQYESFDFNCEEIHEKSIFKDISN